MRLLIGRSLKPFTVVRRPPLGLLYVSGPVGGTRRRRAAEYIAASGLYGARNAVADCRLASAAWQVIAAGEPYRPVVHAAAKAADGARLGSTPVRE